MSPQKRNCRLALAKPGTWLVLLIFGASGCVGPWRPSLIHVSQPAPSKHISKWKRCLQTDRLGRWVYERSPLPHRGGQPARTYVRQVGVDRLSEGVLEDRPFLKIDRYLDLSSSSVARPSKHSPSAGPASAPAAGEPLSEQRPRAPLKGGAGVFFSLAEPTDPLPDDLDSVGMVTSESAVTYYDYRGIPQSIGTLKRVSEFEGIEDVETKAGRFPGCYRVRVDLAVHFPWIAIIDLTNYLWLSPEVGEVRRVQRLSGWFLIFPFESADDYRLISHTPLPASRQAAATPRPLWWMGAVLIEGNYPTLRVGGMVIDFKVPKTPQ